MNKPSEFYEGLGCAAMIASVALIILAIGFVLWLLEVKQ